MRGLSSVKMSRHKSSEGASCFGSVRGAEKLSFHQKGKTETFLSSKRKFSSFREKCFGEEFKKLILNKLTKMRFQLPMSSDLSFRMISCRLRSLFVHDIMLFVFASFDYSDSGTTKRTLNALPHQMRSCGKINRKYYLLSTFRPRGACKN